MKLFVLADFEEVLDYFARCLLRMAVDLSRIFGMMTSGLNLLQSMKLHGEGLPHWTDSHSGDGLLIARIDLVEGSNLEVAERGSPLRRQGLGREEPAL